jgi:cytochrome c553
MSKFNKQSFLFIMCALFGFTHFATANVQETQTTIKPDASKGEAIYTKGLADRNIPACMSCHGANGNSGGGANPKLAGQHAAYIYKQLMDFKGKKERNNPIMSPYASVMTDQEMKNVAAYLQKQTIKTGSAKTAQGMELGQKIYRGGIASKSVPACAACHGPNGSGIPNQYPRIGGQWSEYTKAQLLAFKAEVRKNNKQMHTISTRMSDKEIDAVADYISGLH